MVQICNIIIIIKHTVLFKSLGSVKYLKFFERSLLCSPSESLNFCFNFLDELAQSLSSRVRVLCWIMTRPENHLKKLQHVGATWAEHCNQVLYMSSQSSDFPTVGLNVSEGRSQLYWKTIRAFQYIHAHHLQHADWFLKADDDTFVVDTEKPVYFSHRFRLFVRQGYMSRGAGYILSPEALRRFVQGFSTGRCENFSSVEDMALGRCMETMGVKAGDSRDPKQRETFNHLIAPENGKQVWSYSYYRPRQVSASFPLKKCVITHHFPTFRIISFYLNDLLLILVFTRAANFLKVFLIINAF
uniref:N-acetylgalactosaminide beta-1,3-galactosyltransferase n=1 Tax=Sinocyclocheilus anshuiensis TaxID=1608454 RepID=A0A671R8N3_9TELE